MNCAGIDFYRLVSSESDNGWSQVYVKIPFDGEEWQHKGALLGVIKADEADTTGWETEVLAEVDQCFNGSDLSSGLSDLVEKTKKQKVSSAWVWIEAGKNRRVRVWSDGMGEVRLMRKGKWVSLTGSGRSEKIISGEIGKDDRLLLLVGGIKELEIDSFDEELNQRLRNIDGSWAGLLVEVRGEEDGENLAVKEESSTNLKTETEVIRTSIKPNEEIKLRTNKPKWGLLVLGLVFLVLLIVSVVFGSVKMIGDKEKQAWLNVAEPIEKMRLDAEAEIGVNKSGARVLMIQALDQLKNNGADYEKGKFASEYLALKEKLDNTWVKVSGEKQVGGEVWMDLALIRNNLKGTRLGLDGEGRIIVMDSDAGLGVVIDTKDKSSEMVWGNGKDGGWIDVAGDDKGTVLLMKDKLVVNQGKNDLEKVFDSAVLQPVAEDVFGGAAYVLDDGAEEIWKYAIVNGSWGERKGWLAEGVDLIKKSKLVDLAIDGDIWVLDDSGVVTRYRRGSVERFSLTGFSESFVGYRIAVEVSGDRLAVLDKDKGRIIFFSKDTGEYLEQIISDNLKKANDIVFNEDGKIMVLEDGKLIVY